MKVLVIQPKIGMGDMVIYLPYIHAISKKYKTAVSILVKENSRAKQLLTEDKHIKEILILDRTKNNSGAHDGPLGFFKLSKDLKLKKYDKVFILMPWKDIYIQDNERYETFEQATEIHEYLIKWYTSFNYELVEVPQSTLKNRVDFILNNI